MKLEGMQNSLCWLIKYMRENKPEDFEKRKEENPRWLDLDRMSLEMWVNIHGNTKSNSSLRIEELLRQLKLISHKECGDSDELKKPALRAITELMKIKEYNHKISRKDLERKISRFAKASA